MWCGVEKKEREKRGESSFNRSEKPEQICNMAVQEEKYASFCSTPEMMRQQERDQSSRSACSSFDASNIVRAGRLPGKAKQIGSSSPALLRLDSASCIRYQFRCLIAADDSVDEAAG